MTTTRTAAAAPTPGAAAAAAPSTAKPRRRLRTRTRIELVVLLAPALVLFLAFVILPTVSAAIDSVFDWSGYGPLTDFVGLGNYTKALTDPVFLEAIGHNLFIAIGSVAIQLPLSIAIALLLNGRIRGRAILRTLVFVPWVLSEAVTAVIWVALLQPGGAFDVVLSDLGLKWLTQDWLADGNVVMYSLFLVMTWKYIGFGIILFLAGLAGIPEELKEAAALDGASAWQITRRITIPLLAPTIRIWTFLSVIGSLQLFDLVFIMTGGGPASASETMATYLINFGFTRNQLGYGGAVSVILFAICFLFAIVYQRFVLSRDSSAADSGRVE